ncbi:hypothetical protein VPHK406_0087 [Vibrio phage K406]
MKNNRKIEVGQVRAAQFGTEYEYWYVVTGIKTKAEGQYCSVDVTIIKSLARAKGNFTWFDCNVMQDVVVM